MHDAPNNTSPENRHVATPRILGRHTALDDVDKPHASLMLIEYIASHAPAFDNIPLPHRLRHAIHLWKLFVHDDHDVLRMIERGYDMQWKQSPPASRPTPFALSRDPHVRQLVLHEHNRLRELGVLRPARATTAFHRWFAIPKKDHSKVRLIADLRQLNEHIRDPPAFKMETIEHVRSMMQPGDWMVTFDLQDAYYHLPIAEQNLQHLCLLGPDGDICQLTAMPMGFADSGRVLTRTLQQVTRLLRTAGIRCSIYVDDGIVLGQSADGARDHGNLSIRFLQALGFTINLPKCHLEPTQRHQHLGFALDTVAMRLSLTQARIDKIRNLARQSLQAHWSGNHLTLRQLAQLQGTLTASWPAATNTRYISQPIERAIRWLQRHHHGWDAPLQHLPTTVVQALKTLRSTTWTHATTAPIHKTQTPDYILNTDASDYGMGAWLLAHNNQQGRFHTMDSLSAPWSRSMISESINLKEATTVAIATNQFHLDTRIPPNSTLLIECDNAATLSYLRRRGGRLQHLAAALAPVFALCLRHNWHVQTRYISTHLNTTADDLSRLRRTAAPQWLEQVLQPHEWTTTAELRRLVHHLIQPTLDAFATITNRAVNRFCARLPHIEAQSNDGLLTSWRAERVFAAPPTPLLPQVLAKIFNEPEATIALIGPMWPQQPWFATIRQLQQHYQATLLTLPAQTTVQCSPHGDGTHSDNSYTTAFGIPTKEIFLLIVPAEPNPNGAYLARRTPKQQQ